MAFLFKRIKIHYEELDWEMSLVCEFMIIHHSNKWDFKMLFYNIFFTPSSLVCKCTNDIPSDTLNETTS